MRTPAAKQGDEIKATDAHLVVVPTAPPTQVLAPHTFAGVIDGGLSDNVRINQCQAATVGSTATNREPHAPAAPGNAFVKPPSNRGTISEVSRKVRINGRAAARDGDIAETCNDPADAPVGVVVAKGNVRIGD
jgi:uncharacterized Zn-binding protein involved in type VI secretion